MISIYFSHRQQKMTRRNPAQLSTEIQTDIEKFIHSVTWSFEPFWKFRFTYVFPPLIKSEKIHCLSSGKSLSFVAKISLLLVYSAIVFLSMNCLSILLDRRRGIVIERERERERERGRSVFGNKKKCFLSKKKKK